MEKDFDTMFMGWLDRFVEAEGSVAGHVLWFLCWGIMWVAIVFAVLFIVGTAVGLVISIVKLNRRVPSDEDQETDEATEAVDDGTAC
ncbi:MAG: hypothetical protein JFR38_08675 [Muribaculaceae bacterium]|nr:hypothetical protein [Muribaculaceae bacterium]